MKTTTIFNLWVATAAEIWKLYLRGHYGDYKNE